MEPKRYSLYSVLGLIIFVIATVSITMISSYKYIQTKEDLQSSIENRSIDTLDKVKQLIIPYIESYSVSEYENLIKNEMKNKNIFAIIVKDYKMAKILGKEFFVTGKARDSQWNIINYDEFEKQKNNTLEDMYSSHKAMIENKEGIIIGEVLIYNTDMFLKEELSMIIKESILFIFVISAILIILSFFLIHKIIIKPLGDIIDITTQNSSHTINLTPIKEKGFKEIFELSATLNKMIYAIQESQVQLNDMNKHLNDKVKEKTQELQELNTSLEKRIEQELEKGKQKDLLLHNQSRFASMGEMIGNIAHQWRQPLNALSITVQKIQRYYQMGKLDEETMDKSIDKSMNLIQKMSSTIDDFMGFFREDKVKISFDVGKSIEETISLLDASLKNSFIEFHFNKPEDIIKLNGYKGEFTQVVLNIVSNAKDAIKDNGIKSPTININLHQDDQFIIIEIIDNAGGVPEDIIDSIFDPYFTTKEEGKGTGIGLYMSKVIIEQNMQGELGVKNTEDGACFIIRLKKENI